MSLTDEDEWADWNSEIPNVPENAVCGGINIDGGKIYVGRAFHEGNILPAKIIPNTKSAYVSFGGQEYSKAFAQVLVESEHRRFSWVEKQGTSIPFNAVKGGQTDLGEPLYIGRLWFNSSKTIGKVHPSHGCLYISSDGHEHAFKKYEILTRKSLKETVQN